MAIFSNSIIPAAAAADGDVVTKSVRFNYGDTPSIHFTPSSSGNTKKWTSAFWFKRSELGLTSGLFGGHGHTGNNGVAAMYFSSVDNGKLHTYFDAAVNYYGNINDRLYRDTAGWMQIIWAVDAVNTTQRIWINGVEESVGRTLQNADYGVNYSGVKMELGGQAWGTTEKFDGYIAQLVHLDGQYITDPTEFGQVSETSGSWTPKEFTSSSFTYGTNGALLEFLETGTSADSSGIGADTSGNDNHWSVTNLAASDVVNDTPTNNYAVLNPFLNSAGTLSEGNLQLGGTGTGYARCYSTMKFPSGSWYYELYLKTAGAYSTVGVSAAENLTSNYIGGSSDGGVGYGMEYGRYFANGGWTSYGSALSAGDILMVAFDADTGKIWFGKNGTWFASGNPATGANASYTVSSSSEYWAASRPYGASAEVVFNFGQDPFFAGGKTSGQDTGQSEFYYEPPSGFLALCTSNLTASIAKPSEHFDVLTYAGSGAKTFDNGSTSMPPDLVWVKARGNAYDHELTDSVRGVTKALSSNDDGSESNPSTGLTAFGSDGFTVGAGTNYSTSAMVAWSWKAGTSFTAESGVSDSGSKNVDAGFSIATWTGDDDDFSGSSQTITHGLGVVPEMIIAKGRTDNDSMGSNWFVYHKDLDSNNYLILNSTDGQQDAYLDVIDNIGTSSADFGTDSSAIHFNYGGDSSMPIAADTYVAYFFASKAGYSKIGSWVGTGSASTAPFIYTGFRPAYVMHKEIDTSSYNWVIHDSARDPFNDDSWNHLIADRSDDENGDNTGGATAFADFVSNGFNLNSASVEHGNGSGKTYIYIAFAETPLKYANAR